MRFIDTLNAHRGLSITAGIILLLLIAIITFSRVKKVAPVSWGWFGAVNTTAGLALAGSDPLTYHAGQPQAGDATHTSTWNGAEWRFVSAANKAAFDADPARYAPRFGGFCAFAVSKGFTAGADGSVWHVEGDALYVFDSDSVKTDWLAKLAENRTASETNWAKR